MPRKQNIIIISASSDIGTAMCQHWISEGKRVFATYRTESSAVRKLGESGVHLVYCDLGDTESVGRACSDLQSLCQQWDTLVLCPGILQPIGPFVECDFNEWDRSVRINFISQLNIVHELLESRNRENTIGPCVLFFAGGGTNNATENFSAYTISKIALIKMCELFDAEIPDTRFTIVGPGWVKTKIHNDTLAAGSKAGASYERTKSMLIDGGWVPMEDVLKCCDWLINSGRDIIGGRNFSVAFDDWGSGKLTQLLLDNPGMYKLRRSGNDTLKK